MLKCLLIVLVLLGGLQISFAESSQQNSLQIDPVHPVIRPGLIHRFRIHLPSSIRFDSGVEAQLVCSVLVGDDPLLQRDFGFVSAQDLRVGIMVNWVVPEDYRAGPVRIRASWLHGSPPFRGERGVLDVRGLGQDLSRLGERMDGLGLEAEDPLPYLWLEQAALELQAAGDLFSADLIAQKRAQVANWLNGQNRQPTSGEFAFRCQIDGSVQPYRWFPSRAAEARGVVLLFGEAGGLQPSSKLTKSRWRVPERALLGALSAAGLHVLQIYPGGDATWEGVGLARVYQVRENLRQRNLLSGRLPWHGMALGNGAGGLVRFAMDNPHLLQSLIIADGRVDRHRVAAKPQGEGATGRSTPSRQLALRGPHLGHLPIVVRGDLGKSLNWLRAYNASFATESELHDQAWWTSLVTATSSPPDLLEEYVVLQPGVLGPFVVHDLSDPERPGRIVFDPESRRIELMNISRLSWRQGLALAEVELPPHSPNVSRSDVARMVDGYARGPFVVVIGTGEHAERQMQNRALAQDFVRRWVDHAQGAPPIFLDRDFDPERYQNYHWVLFGGPRSNALSAGLQQRAGEEWPVESDARTIRIDGQRYLRSKGVGVVYAVTDPNRTGYTTVIVDGKRVADTATYPWRRMGRMLWQIGDETPRFAP